MHVDIRRDNIEHAIRAANELDCSVADYVNSLLAAMRESEYTREFTIHVVSKENPQKKTTKKIVIRRRTSSIKYIP